LGHVELAWEEIAAGVSSVGGCGGKSKRKGRRLNKEQDYGFVGCDAKLFCRCGVNAPA